MNTHPILPACSSLAFWFLQQAAGGGRQPLSFMSLMASIV